MILESIARAVEQQKRFSEGWKEAGDNQRPGRAVFARTQGKSQKNNEIVHEDRSLNLRMNPDITDIKNERVRQMLHDELNMTKVCVNKVLENVNQIQMDNRCVLMDPCFVHGVKTCSDCG